MLMQPSSAKVMHSSLQSIVVIYLTTKGSVPRPGHLPHQVGLHGGPLARDDAVDVSVAQCSVRGDLVVSQDAVELCAKALNSPAALMVEGVRAEFDRDAVERLECMRQQEELALGVESRALDALAVPGRADLDPPIDRIDVHIGSHSNRATDWVVDDRERQHRASRLQGQPPADFRAHCLGLGTAGVPKRPQRAVLDGLDQLVAMTLVERLKSDAWAA